MSARFENVQPGDQLEMPASRMPSWRQPAGDRDPSRPADVAMVTHRWHDHYEGKDYVCLARIHKGGGLSKPIAKHTIRGLAQAGWMPARRDWMVYARALEAGEIVPLRRRK